jgi:hypothetical protein
MQVKYKFDENKIRAAVAELGDYPTMGILGHDGEFRPRYGLWLNTSAECKTAVQGILTEGYTCEVVLKLGYRCARHDSKSHRPVIELFQYAATIGAGAELEIDCNGPHKCYVREVFFPETVKLRRRSAEDTMKEV